jgi:hypothetical protein
MTIHNPDTRPCFTPAYDDERGRIACRKRFVDFWAQFA